jgi:hypothetical protein
MKVRALSQKIKRGRSDATVDQQLFRVGGHSDVHLRRELLRRQWRKPALRALKIRLIEFFLLLKRQQSHSGFFHPGNNVLAVCFPKRRRLQFRGNN